MRVPIDGASSADLYKGAEALRTFKSKIDSVLKNFHGSAAGHVKLSEQTITRAAFSGQSVSFPPADDLHRHYSTVHERLMSLSKMLSLQIEAMGIAAHGADIGFDNLDEEQRQRYWQIQTQITQYDQQHEQQPAGRAPIQHSHDHGAEKGSF